MTNEEDLGYLAPSNKRLLGVKIKALTALVGRLYLIVDCDNSPERGLTIVSINP